MSRGERLGEVALDRASSEGALLAWRGDQLSLRRFDKSGNFLGESTAYPHPVGKRSGPGALVRFGTDWFALLGDEVLPLSSGEPPQRPVPDGFSARTLLVSDGKLTLVAEKDAALHALALDEHGKRSAGPRKIADLPGQESYRALVGVVRRPEAAPLLAFKSHRFSSGLSVLLELLEVGARGAWKKNMEIPYNQADVDTWRYQEVPGDLVFLQGKNPVIGVWLTSGKREATTLPAGAEGSLVLPSESPGQWMTLEGLREAGRSCRKVIPGGGGALLVCAEGVSPLAPGTRIRMHRWSPKAP